MGYAQVYVTPFLSPALPVQAAATRLVSLIRLLTTTRDGVVMAATAAAWLSSKRPNI